MATYASSTEVTSDRSRMEIERTLTRYGADEFGYMTKSGMAAVAFVMHARQIRFVVPLPDKTAREFTLTPTGKKASASAVESKFEQAIRQRWRALALVVKAKLEAVEAGISEFEQEFGMHIVLPGGQTVYEHTKGWIADAYQVGQVAPLLAIEGGKS